MLQKVVSFLKYWFGDFSKEELKKYIVKPPHEPKFDFSLIELPAEGQTKITDFIHVCKDTGEACYCMDLEENED